MNSLSTNLIASWLLVLLCFTSGCTTISKRTIDGNYEVITCKTRSVIAEPDAYRITLQYRDATGARTVIWPMVGGGPTIHDNVAVFTADSGGRMFAVEGSGPLVEISGLVLRRWADESGVDLSQAWHYRTSLYYLDKQDQLEFHFPSLHQDRVIQLNWHQIGEIVAEVKNNGVATKDAQFGIIYLEENVAPGSNK